MAEGGLNPWRWEGDVVNLNRGYGLFQYTPASEYINTAKNVNYYAPNLSVTSITTDAKPTDAIAQLEVFDRNLLSKWVSTCWRNYWSTDTYSSLYQDTRRILFTYGSNQRLSMEQFKRIDDIYDATLAFLACFEGPQVPNMATRYSNARLAYNIITGKPPTPPTPPTPTKRKLPIWMMIKPF